jgi:hypothetical protein
VLKTPSHLHHLRALRTVFPDVTLVQTHRDPVTSIVSSADMVTYLHRGYYPHPDPPAVARSIADFLETGLRAAEREHRHVVHLPYRRLLDDPIGAVEEIYGGALTRPARARMVWNSDGTPNLGTPDRLSTSLTAPSGDPGGSVAVRQWSALGNACQQWTITT